VWCSRPTPTCTYVRVRSQLFHKAGFPAGLVNLVTGKGSEIGDFLTQHPSVNCISFTGGNTGWCSSMRAC